MADIRVLGSTIAEIGVGLESEDRNAVVINASGKLVLPGGIDPHVHLGGIGVDDYTTGSAAALAGGITTISNFSSLDEGQTLVAAVQEAESVVRNEAIADVIFHPIVSDLM